MVKKIIDAAQRIARLGGDEVLEAQGGAVIVYSSQKRLEVVLLQLHDQTVLRNARRQLVEAARASRERLRQFGSEVGRYSVPVEELAGNGHDKTRDSFQTFLKGYEPEPGKFIIRVTDRAIELPVKKMAPNQPRGPRVNGFTGYGEASQ